MNTIQEDIREGNELIALWMGAVKETPGFNRPYFRFDKRESYMDRYSYPIHALAYHSSWDWLMPVVEKIGNTRLKSTASYNPDLMFRIEIVNGYTKIEGTGENISANSSIEGSMLLATWKCVVAFIRWYNASQPR